MKKWMTLIFASMFTLALSMPAWSQAGAKKQTAAATQADKKAKKEQEKKDKEAKKAAAKKAKEDKKKSASKK